MFFLSMYYIEKGKKMISICKKKNLNMTVGIVDRRHFVCAKVSNFYGSQDTIHSILILKSTFLLQVQIEKKYSKV